jgi:hypothetical protein
MNGNVSYTPQSGREGYLTLPSHTTRHAALPQGDFRWARTGRFMKPRKQT